MLFNYQAIEIGDLNAERGVLSTEPYKNRRWKIQYFITLDSRTFYITADASGVLTSGLSPTFTTQEELDEFYKVMQWAFRHHQSLKATGMPLDQDQLTAESLT